ncbi:hypothetical protein LUZ62_088290 [Rhynchospora pubera]|uniref:KIB1-4 beta-propeller domain-containing protein n=1 Tax=Rhynchospora pubera TaxID=906938 RepID=A0AAV8CGE8_9POAL|nr:hypothetical protein LUZ62_088290 [Rhynchospora pubera]
MGKLRLQRDWAALPEELVTIIGEKVTTNTAYIISGWFVRPGAEPSHPTPAISLPNPPGSCSLVTEKALNLISMTPFSPNPHRFRCPYMRGKYICGSSHGWLLLEHDYGISLFNPITQSSIDLPSFYVPQSVPIPPRLPGWKFIISRNVKKATLSHNPSNDCCVVAAQFIAMSKWELAFCRIGDTHWTGLLPRDMHQQMLLDFGCHKNMVYTVNRKMEVSVYDLNDLSLRTFPSKISYNRRYD